MQKQKTVIGYLYEKPMLYDEEVDEGEEYVVSYDVSDTSSFGPLIHVVQYGDGADTAAQIFLQGSKVKVTGIIHNEEWVDKSGRTHERGSLEALEVELLSLFGL